ncbi:phosphoethanolamine N-methyltransferase 1-like, partial [Limulus polyphemus]|uniref:phosphoethanolamine N-methyltransferase n=1 Tax=Limulus polyphemus TaxID=6850 RepID=A0ABM1RVS9_LIMPO
MKISKDRNVKIMKTYDKMTHFENSTENFSSFQQFLDSRQYSRNGVKRYEWIFGKTFLSTGGKSLLQNIVSQLKLKAGEKVLDVGIGLGGHDFYMAEVSEAM